MNDVRVISDVPKDNLEQVVTDLGYEVGKDRIRVSLQANGKWKVEYVVSQINPNVTSTGTNSGSTGSNSGSSSSFWRPNI
jgi:hypothetical protein